MYDNYTIYKGAYDIDRASHDFSWALYASSAFEPSKNVGTAVAWPRACQLRLSPQKCVEPKVV